MHCMWSCLKHQFVIPINSTTTRNPTVQYFFVWHLAANSSCSFTMPSTLVVFSIINQLISSSQMVGNDHWRQWLVLQCSHGKSFSHARTNFRFDEDWDVLLPESSIPLFEVEVVDVWDDSDDFDDDRNALISILNESNHAWRSLHFKMADKRFLIALHHGYVTWSHVSSIKQINMAANEHELVTK